MDDDMTTTEAAAELCVAPSTVSRMVARGELAPVRKLPGKRGAFLFAAATVREKAEARVSL